MSIKIGGRPGQGEAAVRLRRRPLSRGQIVSGDARETLPKIVKPPFACDGGPFLEDRLCREMPEKRCQKLLEEYELKKEKLEEKLEEEANSKCELKSAEIKTSVEKEKCKPLSEICPEIPKPEFKDECANPLHETVCIPVVDHQLSINKCRHVKACKAKMTKARECDSSNLKPCQTVPDCSTINKDMSIELRPCSAIESIAKCPIKVNPCDNVKPCPSKKVEEAKLTPATMSNRAPVKK
ncbi:hypothetical protein QE152_g1648 [Popillia japonica]|uniref:Uncharacterized protein n=1 Tax=Popillia japonica TaxID=7064 RepID=A0AAW1N750_POPJA